MDRTSYYKIPSVSSSSKVPIETPSPHSGQLSEPLSTDPTAENLAHNKEAKWHTKWIQDWWVLEIVACLLGTASLISLCAVLYKYDKHPAPKVNEFIGISLTLNTLVSILSTIGRAALLWSVTECLSQWKWTWFSTNRPLEDLATFDSASRGAWGSIWMLLRIKVNHFASLGALLIILGLVIDPLSQQLVHYELRSVKDDTGVAQLGRTTIWTPWPDSAVVGPVNGSLVFAGGNLLLNMKSAALRGLLSHNTRLNYTQPVCSTGNCTWPTYKSLGVCSRISDVTSHLQVVESDDNNQTLALNNRSYISLAPTDTPNLLNISSASEAEDSDSCESPFRNSIGFPNQTGIVADVFMVYKNMANISDNSYSALEFILQWCVHSFETSVVNGSAKVSTLGLDYFQDPNPLLTGTDEYTSVTLDGELYAVDESEDCALREYLEALFTGSSSIITTGTSPVDNQSIAYAVNSSSDASQALLQALVASDHDYNAMFANQTGIRDLLDNMAISFTNELNNQFNPYDLTIVANIDIPQQQYWSLLNGTANSLQSYVVIQWGWIAALGAFTFVSLIFVAVTILARHEMVWKSSLTPVLQSLSVELHKDLGGMKQLSSMDVNMRTTRVKLVDGDEIDEGGWRLFKAS